MTLDLRDVFDMGYAWRGQLVGQTLEDSRAVGRTLFSDTFETLRSHIDASRFDSFQDADLGICAAKQIIHDALVRVEGQHMKLGERDLLTRVRERIGFSKRKHRAENVTDKEIEEAIDVEIDLMTNLELLAAISLELSEAAEEP